MPSFNFQPQFASAVKRNTKGGTIRKERKDMHVGDMMHCFTGMRTKKCKRIVSRKCLAIVDIEVPKSGAWIKINGNPLDEYDATEFAELDGFKKKYKQPWTVLLSMKDFFEKQYGLPFHGKWYVWKQSALNRFVITHDLASGNLLDGVQHLASAHSFTEGSDL